MADHTDRELLELAAKAASITPPSADDVDEIGRQYVDSLGLWVGEPWGWHWWNPLADDGAALRLATRMLVDVEQGYDYVRATTADEDSTQHDVDLDDPDDFAERCSATRRAIVCAAAHAGSAA